MNIQANIGLEKELVVTKFYKKEKLYKLRYEQDCIDNSLFWRISRVDAIIFIFL